MTIPIISALKDTEQEIEIVERKGLGHPDTICDALAESFSRNLCREYRRRFGQILHHNVDKALLCGGRASPAFSGGTVLAPMNLYLAGRAVAEVGNDHIPIREIAVEGSRSWIRANLHAIDAERHINIHELVQPGSHDLQALFSRSASHNAPLANDTSIGVGYAPMIAWSCSFWRPNSRSTGRTVVDRTRPGAKTSRSWAFDPGARFK